MSTLYLDRRDLALKLEGRALAVYASGVRQSTVPLHLLERLVLRSSVQLETGLLARLADAGVGVLAFGGRNGAKIAFLHGSSHNEAARRIGQYRLFLDQEWRLLWSRRLVRGKLRGQSRLLRRGLIDRPDRRRSLTRGLQSIEHALDRLRSVESVDSLRGIEGAAAAAYFKAFGELFPPSVQFEGRNRRPPRDPVNAVLSLGYTLLHFEAARACRVAGLDPLIGYFHELELGRESLASDLIEPLRPRLDAWAWEQFRNRDLREEHFTRKDGACLLGKTGRGHFFRSFEGLAGPLRRYLRRLCGKLAGTMIASAKTTVREKEARS